MGDFVKEMKMRYLKKGIIAIMEGITKHKMEEIKGELNLK